jgi:hypothetical protein
MLMLLDVRKDAALFAKLVEPSQRLLERFIIANSYTWQILQPPFAKLKNGIRLQMPKPTN